MVVVNIDSGFDVAALIARRAAGAPRKMEERG
jgi:hypothetical protein